MALSMVLLDSKYELSDSGEVQEVSLKIALVCTHIDSHVGYRVGVAIPHRPSTNTGQFLYSYPNNKCIPVME